MEVDYDLYADGEAELGWLNCQVHVVHPAGSFKLDELAHCNSAQSWPTHFLPDVRNQHT